QIKGVALRSMKEPGTAYDDPLIGKDPQPAHMKDFVKTTRDNGGVHINSGIPNKAFYEVAKRLGGYAWERAGRIWYITLRDRLRPYSQFQECAEMTYAVAGELYGARSPEQQAVREGWGMVGISVGQPLMAAAAAS
ncbi:MAG TPA: M4 family metallopeptidase, partial [Blastocatellia bacterium]|nr:M4 family metallopeptidase [Blastocatellia bacterium]